MMYRIPSVWPEESTEQTSMVDLPVHDIEAWSQGTVQYRRHQLPLPEVVFR